MVGGERNEEEAIADRGWDSMTSYHSAGPKPKALGKLSCVPASVLGCGGEVQWMAC